MREDAQRLAAARLRDKAQALLAVLEPDSFQSPPSREKLAGPCSRRIDIQHRLVYQVIEDGRVVKVLQMWSHHE
jgi:toxin YoeB